VETNTSDIIFGAVVLAVVLVLAIAAGKLLNKFKNSRFAKAWQPLIPILNGTIINDNGGGASSYLAGTYKGRIVQAGMVPNRNRYSGDNSGQRYNYFEIALQQVNGVADWKVSYKHQLLGIGKKGWHLESLDKQLEDQLNNAGVVDLVSTLGTPTIDCKAT
jgi:hypothetical protein